METKKIIFTGGGSGGHVIPARTLIRHLKKNYDLQISYIGSYEGIEKDIIKEGEGISYKGISTGKLRRYLSLQNFLDLFKIFWGIIQSFVYLFKFNSSDTVVFSTGGFVTVPVVLAAWLHGIKVVIHEQTTRVGLANKIASQFADMVLVSFEESLAFFPKTHTVHSGYPVQQECYESASSELVVNGEKIETNKPIFFCTGGGNGSLLLNNSMKEIMEGIKKDYFVIHQVGKNFLSEYKAFEDDSYRCYDFINSGMVELMKQSKIIISRAGAGTVCELMAVNKPSVFVPLKIAQKNEQFHNAKAAEKSIGSIVIEEKDLSSQSLLSSIEILAKGKKNQEFQFPNGLLKITSILEEIR